MGPGVLKSSVGFTLTALTKLRELGIDKPASDIAKALRGLPCTQAKNGAIHVEYGWWVFVLRPRVRKDQRNGGLRVVNIYLSQPNPEK